VLCRRAGIADLDLGSIGEGAGPAAGAPS